MCVCIHIYIYICILGILGPGIPDYNQPLQSPVDFPLLHLVEREACDLVPEVLGVPGGIRPRHDMVMGYPMAPFRNRFIRSHQENP